MLLLLLLWLSWLLLMLMLLLLLLLLHQKLISHPDIRDWPQPPPQPATRLPSALATRPTPPATSTARAPFGRKEEGEGANHVTPPQNGPRKEREKERK
jgi:hypothetical protein